MRNADGSEIPTHGRRLVRFQLEDGHTASVEFQVMNVKRCIFSIGRLIEQGFGIDFENQILTGPDKMDDRPKYTDRSDSASCEHISSNQGQQRR